MRNGCHSINPRKLLVILGPTASGKTALAVSVAKKLKGEIISADSRQVYRGMDIGTGKDLSVYRDDVPYHLIDIRDPRKPYDVGQYKTDFNAALERVFDNKKLPILCGGSGMYIQAVLQDFKHVHVPQNPSLRKRLETMTDSGLYDYFKSLKSTSEFRHDIRTRKRLIRAIEIASWLSIHGEIECQYNVNFRCQVIGLNPAPAVRRARISARLSQRLKEGLLQEVEGLIQNGVPEFQLIRYGLEYKWSSLFLRGELTYTDFVDKLEVSIHQYAKRQMTYFRKMEKDGIKIHWLKSSIFEEQVEEVIRKQSDFL